MGKQEKLSGRERVARRRAALRAQGLRPKQIWVPDLRLPEVQAQIRREAQLLADNPHNDEEMAFIDAITDWDSFPPYDN